MTNPGKSVEQTPYAPINDNTAKPDLSSNSEKAVDEGIQRSFPVASTPSKPNEEFRNVTVYQEVKNGVPQYKTDGKPIFNYDAAREDGHKETYYSDHIAKGDINPNNSLVFDDHGGHVHYVEGQVIDKTETLQSEEQSLKHESDEEREFIVKYLEILSGQEAEEKTALDNEATDERARAEQSGTSSAQETKTQKQSAVSNTETTHDDSARANNTEAEASAESTSTNELESTSNEQTTNDIKYIRDLSEKQGVKPLELESISNKEDVDNLEAIEKSNPGETQKCQASADEQVVARDLEYIHGLMQKQGVKPNESETNNSDKSNETQTKEKASQGETRTHESTNDKQSGDENSETTTESTSNDESESQSQSYY